MGMVTDLAGEKGSNPRSRVLILLNMVTGDDLMDADEYDDILQDVKEECDRYGKVLDLQIPRPLGRSGEGPGVGKVFVRFENEEGCAAALKGLAGRKFAERTVVASYYPEVFPPASSYFKFAYAFRIITKSVHGKMLTSASFL